MRTLVPGALLLLASLAWPGAGRAEDDAKPVRESEAAAAEETSEATDDDDDVHTEGETKVKAMEFSGLDIEGQLKTPQMLYFLNRLKAEFGRPRLPHRSFMPELRRSTRGKSF